MRGPSFKVTVFTTIHFFSGNWRFQIEILIVALGSWPVRGPCFKATVCLLFVFLGDSRFTF